MSMSDPFSHEPRSDREILRELWALVATDLLPQVRRTNGRVTRLERWMWSTLGGLAVISAIVVPLFLASVLGR